MTPAKRIDIIMINSRSAIKNERVTFMYYNMDTNSLVAKTDEELNAYS